MLKPAEVRQLAGKVIILAINGEAWGAIMPSESLFKPDLSGTLDALQKAVSSKQLSQVAKDGIIGEIKAQLKIEKMKSPEYGSFISPHRAFEEKLETSDEAREFVFTAAIETLVKKLGIEGHESLKGLTKIEFVTALAAACELEVVDLRPATETPAEDKAETTTEATAQPTAEAETTPPVVPATEQLAPEVIQAIADAVPAEAEQAVIETAVIAANTAAPSIVISSKQEAIQFLMNWGPMQEAISNMEDKNDNLVKAALEASVAGAQFRKQYRTATAAAIEQVAAFISAEAEVAA